DRAFAERDAVGLRDVVPDAGHNREADPPLQKPERERRLLSAAPLLIPDGLFHASLVLLNGISRMRLPVAEQIAFASAATTGGRPGSPTPVGRLPLSTKWTFTCTGASFIRATRKPSKLFCTIRPLFAVISPNIASPAPMTAAPSIWART